MYKIIFFVLLCLRFDSYVLGEEFIEGKLIKALPINPKGYGDPDEIEPLLVPFNKTNTPIRELSICMWLKMLHAIEEAQIFSISACPECEEIIQLKVNVQDFSTDDLRSDTIELFPFEWHHMCVLVGETVSTIFNGTIYEMGFTKSELNLDDELVFTIGGESVAKNSFSGLLTDVRFYFKLLDLEEVDKLSLLEEIGGGYKKLLHENCMNDEIEDDANEEKDYVSEEIDYALYQDENQVCIDQQLLIQNKIKELIMRFDDITSCREARYICNRFGGRLPSVTEDHEMNDLLTLLNEYHHVTGISIGAFWVEQIVNQSIICKIALYDPKKGIHLNDITTKQNNLKPICLVAKNQRYHLYIDYLNIDFIPVPHAHFFFESLTDRMSLRWSHLKGKAELIDLMRRGKTVFESDVLDKPAALLGRNGWKGLGSAFTGVFSKCLEEEFTCSSGNCINLTNVCDSYGECQDISDEEFCDYLLPTDMSYDTYLGPIKQKDILAAVDLELIVRSITAVKIEDGTISMDLQLTANWTDFRLKFVNLGSNISSYINPNSLKYIWHPTIVIHGAVGNQEDIFDLMKYRGIVYATQQKTGYTSFVNGYEVMMNNGEDVIITHLKFNSVIIKCSMDLFMFPFDNQVTFSFHMKRKHGAYFFNTFIPCIILEAIGLLTLSMPYDSYSDKVTVTLSCLIVMAALFTQISTSLPTTADPKFIDIWMFTHVGLLFLIFVVHVLFIYLHNCHVNSKDKDDKFEVRRYSIGLRGKISPHGDYNPAWDYGEKLSTQKIVLSKVTHVRINKFGLIICVSAYVIFLLICVLLMTFTG